MNVFKSALENNVKGVENFLDSGGDPNIRDEYGNTLLMFAAYDSREKMVKLLLERGADINLVNKAGGKTFLVSPYADNINIAKMLLDAGADINQQEAAGNTALNIASKRGYEKTVKFLLERGADVNLKNNLNESPLFSAIYEGHENIVKMLVDAGADINEKGVGGDTPLIFSLTSKKSSENIVKILLDAGADINVKRSNGETPLYLASKRNFSKIIDILIEKGANKNDQEIFYDAVTSNLEHIVKLYLDKGVVDVNQKNNGIAPLIVSAFQGHENMVKLLIKYKADINITDVNNRTPLILASFRGYTNIVKLLIENGADVNIKDKNGDTAFDGAFNEEIKIILKGIEKGAALTQKQTNNFNVDVNVNKIKNNFNDLKKFLDSGGDPNTIENKKTLLGTAAFLGYENSVKFLLERGADVNFKDNFGDTALIVASGSWGDNANVVKMLLDAGSNINEIGNGYTALYHAAETKNQKIVKLLLERGADVNFKVNFGETVLIAAIKGGDENIVKMLIKYGANVNQKGWVYTPLLISLVVASENIVKILLDAGADINVTKSDGETPLDIAYKRNFTKIVKMLIEKGASSSQKQTNDFSVNKKIEYEIIKVVGKGSNGEVFLVKDRRTGEKYAMKTIVKRMHSEKIHNELLTKQLSHKNIVNVVDFEELPDKFVVFYKYLPDTVELYSLLDTNKIPYSNKIDISRKLIDALIYLHDKNMIHGDIKPQNILIDKKKFEPYIIDFDMACEFYDKTLDDNKSKKHTNCNDNRFAGTPNYISPYILNNRKFSCSTDVYSLGLTLMCLFLGIQSPPWGRKTMDIKDIYDYKKRGGLKIEGGYVIRVGDNKIVYDKVGGIPDNIKEALNLMIQSTDEHCLDLHELKNLFDENYSAASKNRDITNMMKTLNITSKGKSPETKGKSPISTKSFSSLDSTQIVN